MGEPDRSEIDRVCEVVRRWVRRSYPGASTEDLEQEGCLGVLEAVPSYDPDRGAKFITYAFRGAQLRVWRAMEKDVVWHSNGTHRSVRERRRNGECYVWHRSLDGSADEDGCSLHDRIPGSTDEPTPELWDDDAIQAFCDSLGILADCLSTPKLRAAATELMLRPTATPRAIGDTVGLSHERVHHVRNRAIQMARDRIGVEEWLPRRRMVAVPGKAS